MLDALETRDADRLSAIYRAHWRRTTTELLDLIARHAAVMPNLAGPAGTHDPQREETR